MAWMSSIFQLLFLSPFLVLVLAKPEIGDVSYSVVTPDTPLQCACGEGITKVVIQELNRTVMIPEFQSVPKVFARIVGEEQVAVPMFSNYPEEILEEEVEEKHVDVFNVEYFWKAVKKRTPVYNTTKLLVDKFTLVETPFVNQTATRPQKEVYETTVTYEDFDVDDVTIRYNDTNVYFDKIVYKDYDVIVEDIVYQNVTEIVETIKYVETEVFVWEIELYDTELYEKQVIPRMLNDVEVDENVITPKPVRVPRIKYNNRLVIVHDPVTYINEPHNTPEFYNQTYKVPKEIRRIIPVPKFRPVPVQVPTYTKKPCALEKNPDSFLPPNCPACGACGPCAVCPVSTRNQRSFPSSSSSFNANVDSDIDIDSSKNLTQNPNNFFQYGVRPSSLPLEPNNLPETLFQQTVNHRQEQESVQRHELDQQQHHDNSNNNANANANDSVYEDEGDDENHNIQKKSIEDPVVKTKEITGEGEGDPWAYWLPTINAYRAKFGV